MQQLMTSAAVRTRLGGVSDMTIWRWGRDERLGFPEPVRIRGRRYWRAADLDAWLRSRAANDNAPADAVEAA